MNIVISELNMDKEDFSIKINKLDSDKLIEAHLKVLYENPDLQALFTISGIYSLSKLNHIEKEKNLYIYSIKLLLVINDLIEPILITDGNETRYKVTPFFKEVAKNGGWVRHQNKINAEKENKEQDRLLINKVQESVLKTNKFQRKTTWLIISVAFISAIGTIAPFIKSNIDKQPSQEQQKDIDILKTKIDSVQYQLNARISDTLHQK